MKKSVMGIFIVVLCFGFMLSGVPWVCAAEEGKTDEFTLEEITVTAQKRTEKLQEVTVAASVLSEDSLSNSNVTNIVDLNTLIPSIQLEGSLNGRMPMGMRGISSVADPATVGLTSGVSIMVDGVPVPSDSIGVNELEDVQRVEVLKGPQSTLGGRAASAGVINIVTKVPSKTFKASVGLTATTDNEQQLQGYLSAPFSDKVGFSLSANGKRVEYMNKNLNGGDNTNLISEGVRGKLSFNPNDNLTILLTGHISHFKSKGADLVYEYLTPGARLFPYIPYPAPPDFGLPQSQVLPGINVHYGNTDYVSPVKNSGADIHDKDLSLNIDYTLERYTLGSVTAYQNETQKDIQDIPVVAVYFFDLLTGGMAPHFSNSQFMKFDNDSLTQEFKISSPSEDPINFTAGLFYSDVIVKLYGLRAWVANPLDFNRESETKTYAAYARINWGLGKNTKLVTGLRYNRDELSFKHIQRASQDQPAGVIYTLPRTEDTSSALVGDISLQQNLSRGQMVYLTYARGYKPKVYRTANILKSNGPFGDPVDQEKINHFELGSKGTYLDGRLIVNAAAFDTIYKNFQVEVTDITKLVPERNLQAAGEAETRGIEFDSDAILTGNLKFNLNVAYIDAKFNKFKNAPAYPTQTAAQGATGATQDLSGKPIPDAPKFKATLGVEQRIAQTALPFDIVVGAQYSYRTAALMLVDQNPKGKQPAFGILNLNIKVSSDKYLLTLFVNNVFNKFYLTNMQDFWSGIYGANAVIGFPARDARRYAGLKFKVDF